MSTEEKLGRMRERFGDLAAEAAYEAAHAKAAAEFDAKLAMVPTGSPIERLLVAQMLLEGWSTIRRGRMPPNPVAHPVPSMSPSGRIERGGLLVFAQCPVVALGRKYRVDFVFTTAGGVGGNKERPLGVELDGHNFHEKTKEQASADKARDRALLSRGLTVIRFTGSDVYRDPKAVLDECIATTWRLARSGK